MNTEKMTWAEFRAKYTLGRMIVNTLCIAVLYVFLDQIVAMWLQRIFKSQGADRGAQSIYNQS